MADPSPDPVRPKVGLVLAGGGARAAYQAGVLLAISELLPPESLSPFPIVSGTSAGAINATLIATYALHFRRGAQELAGVWGHISSELVFRTDGGTMFKNLLYWLTGLLHAGFARRNVIALLDNTPLRKLLERHIIFARLQEAIDAGALDALSITCSGYTSSRAVCFYQGKPGLKPWHRTRRLGQPVELRLDHIMASLALPLIFPAVRLGREYYGDGSLRQMAPLSPAVHLGADRILVIGVRNEQANKLPEEGEEVPYPSLGQVAGYLMDVMFSDTLYADLERLQRINNTMKELAASSVNAPPLKVIDTLVIVPSQDMREIAQRHVQEFPRSVRMLLRMVGGSRESGSQFASYLLFESGFCRELLELGRRDALAQADKLLAFLGVARTRAGKEPALS
ncbi:MAG: patatin-like phospholipase family protein [Gammaproteobacteria bacterium]